MIKIFCGTGILPVWFWCTEGASILSAQLYMGKMPMLRDRP